MPVPSAAGMPGALLPGAPYAVLIGAEEIAAFEAALRCADPAQFATARLRNPLATPLSPQRAMMQLAPDDGGEDGEGRTEDGAEDGAGRLMRAMATRAAGRPELLVVVEQAETLTPTALALLQLLPGLRAPDGPAVRVVFQGTPAFRTLLRHPRFQRIRAHVHDDEAMPDEAAPPAASRPLPLSRPDARRGWLVLVGAVLVAAMLSAGLLMHGVTSDAPASAPVSAAPPPAAPPPMVAEVPAIPAPAPPIPAEAAPDPAAARAVLFREFNAFVESRGLAGRLSRVERESLFQEYLVRRHATASATPPRPDTAAAAAGTVEVVIRYPDTLPGAEAQAEAAAALLRQQVLEVVLRPAPQNQMPPEAQPVLRYFRPGDQVLATALALALPPPSGTAAWQVVDMSAAADRPARPTIEVWLPHQPP